MDKQESSFEVSRLLEDLEHGGVSRRDFINRAALLGLGGSFVGAAVAAAPTGVLAASERAKNVTVNAVCITGINDTVVGALIPKFEAKYPHIKVNLIIIPYADVFSKQVLALGARSHQYDVLTQSPSMFPYLAAHHYYADLNPYFNERKLINKAHYDLADFPKAMLNAVGRVGSHLYALPFMQFQQMMFYRKDIVKKHPRTLSEFMDSVKKTNHPPGVYGTTVQGLKAGAGGCVYAWYPYLFTFGGDIAVNGKLTLNSHAAVKALEYYVELFKYAPSSSITYGSDASDVPFLEGRVAQTLENSDHFARFISPQSSTVANKTTFDVMPGLHAGEQGTVMAGCWSFGISKFSLHKPEAFQFITYITSKEAMPVYVANGGLPPRTSTMTSPLYEKSYPIFRWVNKAAKHEKGIPPLKNYLAIENALEDAIDSAILGQKTAKAALDDVQKKFHH